LKPFKQGESDETARAAGGARGGTPRQFQLYRAIVKDGLFHDRVGLTIAHHASFRHLYCALPEVIDGLQPYVVRNQLINGLSGRRGRQGRHSEMGPEGRIAQSRHQGIVHHPPSLAYR